MNSECSGQSRRRFLQTAGIATASGLAGCIQQRGSGDGADADATTVSSSGGGSSGRDDIGSVTFGILSPVSGPFSQLGKTQRQAAKLAVEDVNISDRFDFEIEGVYEDTQTDPSVGQQKAQKVVKQDGASFIAGCINSSVALAVANLATQAQTVYTAGGAAMALTGKNCNTYTFRNETNTAQQAAGLVDFVAANLGTKLWIHTADYAYGNSAIDQIKHRIDQDGVDIDIVGTTKPEPGTSNFGPAISQIENSAADVLAVPLTGGDLINFLKQAAGKGLKTDVDIIGTAIFAQAIRAAVGVAAAGTYSATLYSHKLDTGDNKRFVKRYKDEYGSSPGSFARVGYEAVRMQAHGIRAARSGDPAAVKDALPGLEIPTILGDTQFRACDHQSINPVWTGKLVMPKQGKVPTVDRLQKISGEDVTPPCGATCSLE
jgi:branched-chain amino acid transport system substrate-binding protein